MTEEQYRAWSAPFRKNGILRKGLLIYNHVATLLIAAGYFVALILLGLKADERFWGALLVPSVALLIVTFLRAVVDRARPYEKLDIEPILDKQKKGKSFPSRHTFSAFAIATVFFWLNPIAGAVTAALAVLLGVARVIAGVHYPSDVIAGALIGIALVAAGLYLPEWLLFGIR